MQLLMISYIFQELAKNTRKMLDRIFEAELQNDLKMAQSQLYIDENIQTLNSMAEENMQVLLKEDYSGEFAPIKDAFEQIKQGLSQVSAIVQENTATAEENSASSEEMSTQAVVLREEAGKFQLN